MPFLVTPVQPFLAGSGLPLSSVYAIITDVAYKTREKVIRFSIGYYASEVAYDAGADDVAVDPSQLPRFITQGATPQQANAAPIFDFLETVLLEALRQRHPDADIADAPPAPEPTEPTETPTP